MYTKAMYKAKQNKFISMCVSCVMCSVQVALANFSRDYQFDIQYQFDFQGGRLKIVYAIQLLYSADLGPAIGTKSGFRENVDEHPRPP